MRCFAFLLLVLPLTTFAQAGAQPSDPVLYPYKKPMPPATVVETGGGGIPTDGTAMGNNAQKNRRHQKSGPTWIYREPGHGKPTIITGPDGTTVCTDASGRVTVCW